MKSMTRSTKSRASRTRPGIPLPGGTITAGLAAGALALLATACGTGPAASGIAVPSGAEPVPQDVHTLPDHRLPPGTLGTSCKPKGSLRPAGPLPAPGHMPAGSTMAAIAKRGYLRVGVDQTIDLSSYRNPLTGQLEGFDISVAQQIAQAIFGKPDAGNPDEHIQFKAITSAQRIPVIQKGQVDIVVDSMTITCARQKLVDFSADYFNAGQELLVPKNSPVTGRGDLRGKKVCADAGTTSIQQIQAMGARPVPVAADNWTDCLVMLEQNQIAAISTDNSVLAGLAAQDPQMRLLGPTFTVEQHGIAISKDAPDLVRFVNAVLERMRAEGTWTNLYRQWFVPGLGTTVPAPPVPKYGG
jgi:polar amino acid transport system substrate-binding protein